jgi:hypothetical protein
MKGWGGSTEVEQLISGLLHQHYLYTFPLVNEGHHVVDQEMIEGSGSE